MKRVNLLLEFRMAGDSNRVRHAARIKLDGNGLTVFASDGAVETLKLDRLRSISIQSIGRVGNSA